MKNTQVSLSMMLQWQDDPALHRCRQYFAKANLWRDVFPAAMMDAFNEVHEGLQIECQLGAGEAVEPYTKQAIKTIKRSRFNTSPRPGLQVIPRHGRFYPRNFVRNESAITLDDHRPMRIIAINDEVMQIDLNSPLAPYPLTASVRIEKILPEIQEHGGRCNDFVYDMLQTGIGLQTGLGSQTTSPVDFFSAEPFSRLDPRDDQLFYRTPRLVQHLDETARSNIEALYRSYLQPNMQVLDLMGSWVSHLPADMNLSVTGLGMNEEELKQNPLLTDFIVTDLNTQASLPFDDNVFDVVVCTASVEYLIHPFGVFNEIARCLKPGGKCLMSFSNRWFETKAIRLWSELHPYERVGLVMAYFQQSGLFTDLATHALQHYPRPQDDKYSDRLLYSDPVYAVCATVTK